MPWLRADDTFDTHPKILALATDERRWTWTRVLLYTCRHGGSLIPDGIRDIIPKATQAFLCDCIEIGLVDMVEDRMHVHDWADYNLSRVDGDDLEQRVADALADHPDASANEVHRMVGGRKQAVLSIVRRFRAGSPAGSGTSTEPVPGTGREPVTRADARARPVPAPTPELTQQRELQDAAAGNLEPLRAAGWGARQLDAAARSPELALAHLAAAKADPTATNPSALAWTRFNAGEPVPKPQVSIRSVAENRANDPSKVCPDCGERLGHGHLETCPRMPRPADDDPEPDGPRIIEPPPPELLAAVGLDPDPDPDPEPELDPEPRVGDAA